MKHEIIILISGLLYMSTAGAASPQFIPELIVPGHTEPRFTHTTITPDNKAQSAPDAASLITVPGADYNDNGPLSGQIQYRGMFGPRINVLLDGMYVNSGGPNWMDPPLHYIPMVLLGNIELTRGIGSVSNGAGIGGNIIADYLTSSFGDNSHFKIDGQMKLSSHSVDDGYNFGGIVSAANDRQSIHVLGSYDDGDNREFGAGEISATSYKRAFAGAGYGIKLGNQEFRLNYRRSETGDSGNPVLPLDIDFLATDLVQFKHAGSLGGFSLHTQLNYSHVDHRMTNYLLRSAPDFSSLPLPPFQGTDRRFVDTNSSGFGYRLEAGRTLDNGEVTLGIDGQIDKNKATAGDPDVAAFYVDNYSQATTDRYGFFAQWSGTLRPDLNLEAGIRYERVETDAGAVDAQPANLSLAAIPGTPPFAVRMLRDSFNAQDHSRADDNVDWVAKLSYDATNNVTVELGLARKTRSPGYIERYSWIPLEINAGLGDGNNYVGDIQLEPEVSHQIELGVEWQSERVYFTPRFYYRRVDNYIQGAPSTDMFVRAVSGNANGDPNPLQFTNVNAEIYGFDAMYGLQLNAEWRLDGTLSYTRGKRRDIDDDLYRISPPNTRLSLHYQHSNWSAGIEGIAYASQHHISQVITGNSAVGTTSPTPGYIIANINGEYEFRQTGIRIQAGIDNIFDRDYIDHLSGFNRVAGSDIPLGERLHGPGRNLYATLTYRW